MIFGCLIKILSKMKKYLLLVVGLLFIAFPTFAQGTESAEVINVFDVTTFAGIVAAISLIVTQIAKHIPLIAEKTLYRVLCSLVVGIVCCLFSWWLELADFLAGLIWWQVLLQGLFAGFTSSGAYVFIKYLFGTK